MNVIEGDGPELLARMKAEGKNSPADVFLTVDAGNLWLAEKENLFQPAQSKVLDARIPASLKSPKNLWFGFSTRARLIFAFGRIPSFVVTLAAFLGNVVGYEIGRTAGPAIFRKPNSKIFKQDYVDKTVAFFDRHLAIDQEVFELLAAAEVEGTKAVAVATVADDERRRAASIP